MRDENKYVGKMLRKLRKTNKYTIDFVIDYFNENNLSVSKKTLYGWENGISLPKVNDFLRLCQLYGVEDVLKTFCIRENGENLSEKMVLTSEEKMIIQKLREKDYERGIILRILNDDKNNEIQN